MSKKSVAVRQQYAAAAADVLKIDPVFFPAARKKLLDLFSLK